MQVMKKKIIFTLFTLAVIISCTQTPKQALRLHPQNNHIFEFRGKPELLIGSGEHYGAVMNMDFDYIKYLNTLKENKLNVSRTFISTYIEHPDAFGIILNTITPAANRLIAPWIRSSVAGYAGGGNKFDLDNWDENYFKRLKDFVMQASERDIIIEITLFSSIYGNEQWMLNPFNPINNINDLDSIDWPELLTLKHQKYLNYQLAMTEKIVKELNEYDNFYFEICNEPYINGVPSEWEDTIISKIVETEKLLPLKHLISLNVNNHFFDKTNIGPNFDKTNINPNVSILNIHYAEPVGSHLTNGLNVAYGDNETGFAGKEDLPYRTEAWFFLLNGGALFNHLDYTFTVGHEDGTFTYGDFAPGGGGITFRNQMQFLRDYLYGFDLVSSKPAPEILMNFEPAFYTVVAMKHGNQGYSIYTCQRKEDYSRNLSLRWKGILDIPYSGEYTFFTNSDDGVRLKINGTTLIDYLKHYDKPTQNTAKITLNKGEKAEIELEYCRAMEGAACQLFWEHKNLKRQIIKGSYLSNNINENSEFEYELFIDRFLKFGIKKGFTPKIDFIGELDTAYLYKVPETRKVKIELAIPSGQYNIEWLDPVTGKLIESKDIVVVNDRATITSPDINRDILASVKPK